MSLSVQKVVTSDQAVQVASQVQALQILPEQVSSQPAGWTLVSAANCEVEEDSIRKRPLRETLSDYFWMKILTGFVCLGYRADKEKHHCNRFLSSSNGSPCNSLSLESSGTFSPCYSQIKSGMDTMVQQLYHCLGHAHPMYKFLVQVPGTSLPIQVLQYHCILHTLTPSFLLFSFIKN